MPCLAFAVMNLIFSGAGILVPALLSPSSIFLASAWVSGAMSIRVKFLGRIMLLPVIAGIGYELIKLSAKYSKNPIVKVLIAPGLWLQRLTTKEPNEKQIEVGIKSLKAVIN